MMDKKAMVIEVMDLFDEIERLRWENRHLRESMASGVEVAPTFELGVIDREVMRVGREKVVKESLNYWQGVQEIRDENDNVRPETFHEWLADVVQRSKVPKWASYNDFVSYFEDDLRAIYEERLLDFREGE